MATLSELRTRIRQRSNNEHTSGAFVTNAELNGLINVAYKQLVATLVENSLHRPETILTITADGSTSYTLPVDLYSVLNVYRIDSNHRYRLQRFSDRLRPGSDETGDACHYRVAGNQLILYPQPDSGTYELQYIPIPADLDADDDEVSGVLAWEEYIVMDAAFKVLHKEGSMEEAALCRDERDAVLRRVADQATRQEFNESRVIESVSGDRPYLEGDWTRRAYRGPLW